MKKYKFKYLAKEIAAINNILSENNVTFSFDDINDYCKALEEIAPIVHNSYKRYKNFIESSEGA